MIKHLEDLENEINNLQGDIKDLKEENNELNNLVSELESVIEERCLKVKIKTLNDQTKLELIIENFEKIKLEDLENLIK